jgi:hypothetical protein
MRYVASILLTLSSALWLGLLAALFLFAPAIFQAFAPDKALAGRATSAMFSKFAQAQLALAAMGLLGAFLAYVHHKRPAHVSLFVLFALACVGAVVYKMLLNPKMEELRLTGRTTDPAWAKFHGGAMALSTATALLMLAALLLTAYAQRDLLKKTDPPRYTEPT